MDWDREKHAEKFHKSLIEAFNKETLKSLLYFKFNGLINEIDFDTDLSALVLDLIMTVEKKGLILKLIKEANEFNPGNLMLKEFASPFLSPKTDMALVEISNQQQLIDILGVKAMNGRCILLLSQSVTSTYMFPDIDQHELDRDPFLASRWADEIKYPLEEDKFIIPRVAQFAATMTYQDDFILKTEYLKFMKTMAKPTPFDQNNNSALSLLAQMPFSIYLTTSPFQYIEEALQAAGKNNYTSKHYHWYESQVKNNKIEIGYEPSVDQPLVYHLQGVEKDPLSVVLTEEDYFEFHRRLANDLENRFQSDNRLPPEIMTLLGNNALILLGYNLYDWSFRSFFRGPFKEILNQRMNSVAAQFPPLNDPGKDAIVEKFLKKYFSDARFDLYWGSVQKFAEDLLEKLRA